MPRHATLPRALCEGPRSPAPCGCDAAGQGECSRRDRQRQPAGRRTWLFVAGAAWLVLMPLVAPAEPPASTRWPLLPEDARVTDALEPLIRVLIEAIARFAPYRVPDTLPEVFQLPQAQLEALVCDEPCNVLAAYLPGRGIVLSEHLDPMRELRDRAALLHELVHALQQGHPEFAGMAPCARERAKEEQAYAIQNAYLERSGSTARAAFYEGEFDCAD